MRTTGTGVSLRRAVKPSQSSFHRRSLQRDEPRRRFERKSNPWKGQRTACDARQSARPPPHLALARARAYRSREMWKSDSIILLDGFLERSRELYSSNTDERSRHVCRWLVNEPVLSVPNRFFSSPRLFTILFVVSRVILSLYTPRDRLERSSVSV